MNIKNLEKYVDLDTVLIIISLIILIIALIQFSNIPDYEEKLVTIDMSNDSSPLNYGVKSCSLLVPADAQYTHRENYIQTYGTENYDLKIEFTNNGNELFKLVKDEIGFANIYEYNSTHFMININGVIIPDKQDLDGEYIFIIPKESFDTDLKVSDFVETTFNLKEDNTPMCIIKGSNNDFILHIARNLKIEE